MPTKHPRISVTRDDELAAALDRVRPLFPDRPASWVVRALALEGAEAVEGRERARAEAIERLLAFSSGELEGYDLELLDRIDELAWG